VSSNDGIFYLFPLGYWFPVVQKAADRRQLGAAAGGGLPADKASVQSPDARRRGQRRENTGPTGLQNAFLWGSGRRRKPVFRSMTAVFL
jgi:hypothetical protein